MSKINSRRASYSDTDKGRTAFGTRESRMARRIQIHSRRRAARKRNQSGEYICLCAAVPTSLLTGYRGRGGVLSARKFNSA